MAGLDRHAARLVASEGFAEVHVAMLHGPGLRPGEVLSRVRRRPIFVVPVMMCDGGTMSRDMRAAFQSYDPDSLHFCPPVGIQPRLARLIADRVVAAARRMHVRPADAALLLIAHGSLNSEASADAGRGQADALREMRLFAEVAVAFLDQPPHPATVLGRLTGPVVIVGLFAGAGRHATEDVAAAITAAGRHDVVDLGPIGADQAVASVIASMVRKIARASALEVGAVR